MWQAVPLLWIWSIATASEPAYHVLDTADIDRDVVKRQSCILWWSDLGDALLLLCEAGDHTHGARLAMRPVPEHLILVSGHGSVLDRLGEVLVRSSRFAVVQLEDAPDPDLLDRELDHCHGGWFPFVPDQRVMLPVEVARHASKRETVSTLFAALDGDRWFRDLFTLHQWDRESRRSEVILARDWLVEQMAGLGLRVTLEPFRNGAATNHNVIGYLPGRARPDEIYVIGGHYDSTSSRDNALGPAPGAEDNGSGTAAVLELARIFTAHPPESSMLFIGFSGEEQGLIGSRFHVNQLVSGNLEGEIRAVLIMDMIAYSSDGIFDILLETSASQVGLAEDLGGLALAHTRLEPEISTLPSGSDHVPYLQNGFPAVLIIQSEYAAYPGYHRTTDLSENLGTEQALDVMRMLLAYLADRVY